MTEEVALTLLLQAMQGQNIEWTNQPANKRTDEDSETNSGANSEPNSERTNRGAHERTDQTDRLNDRWNERSLARANCGRNELWKE